MRILFFIVLLHIIVAAAPAQIKVYGTTTRGGDSSVGVIFSINSDGTNFQRLYSFMGGMDGASPDGPLVMGPNTKLYGLTLEGGATNQGTVYSYDTLTHVYQKLADLNPGTGWDAKGGLVWFGTRFYGLAVLGGSLGNGTIFAFDPAAGTVRDVYDLTTATGAEPFGTMTVLKNLLYFTAITGGVNNGGVLNVYDPVGGTVTPLYNFPAGSPGSGYEPWSSLTVMNNVLYGTATLGGPVFFGEVYSYDPAGVGYQVVYDYDHFYDGVYPYGVVPFHGLLFGSTANGGNGQDGGTLSMINPATGGHSQLYSFDEIRKKDSGAFPYGPPVITQAGLMLGMTQSGGSTDDGIIYSFDLQTSTFKKLMDFTGTNGGGPDLNQLFLPGGAGILPIKILRFSGLLTGAGRVLNWAASESAPGGWFQLQRSNDEVNFLPIDSVGADEGTASYSYTDDVEMPGVKVAYYRLKMVDVNQEESYSQIVAIGLGSGGGDSLRLINTAVTGMAYLQYSSGGASAGVTGTGSLDVRLMDMKGMVWVEEVVRVYTGVNSYSIDASALPKGMYVLQAAGRSIKFMKL